MELVSLLKIALRAARTASKAIMEVYDQDHGKVLKEDGSPVTRADLISNELITNILNETKIPIISEETTNYPYEERKKWKRSWIVDPLDGTKEFIKKNGEFAVCIALVENCQPILGIISSPTAKEIVFGGKELGVYRMSFADSMHFDPLESIHYLVKPPSEFKQLIIAGSRSHHSKNDLNFIHEQEPRFGTVAFKQQGSALKFFDLASGHAHVYPRFAPTMEWDICAGQAILEALGGGVFDADTLEPLTYNKEILCNPFFIARTLAYQNWKK